ncbi:hypothetical protein [Teredinibacter purpureus]|uniref:hypothetical protein n=1 Tax=Teredinibacter purpureus TaxID=2731756 RepID=UPI0005F77E3A|nr:hypothetical protein [Teredinibacter purpureus]
MVFALKIVMLVALIQILYQTNKPILCAGIYAGIGFVLGLLFGSGFLYVVISSAIAFGLALVYFALLNNFKDGMLHWVILIGGLVIGLV